ncbi:MAG TPA: DNA polymerase III subunit delta [Fimbriimonas sp.]
MTAEAKKALKHRLIFLHGEEETLWRRMLDELLQEAGLAKDDFDLQSITSDSAPSTEWISGAGIAPFLAQRRTVVVRNILRTDPTNIKPQDLASLPESALLILVADEESGSEDKVNRMKTTVLKGWLKLVDKAGGIALEFKPDAKRCREAVIAEAKNLGKSVTPSAVDTLVEMTGGSQTRAIDELHKLDIFAGSADRISDSDVRDVVVPSREWNVFKMVESTLDGNVPEALRQLRILVSSPAKAPDTAFRSILPTVSTQLRLIWQGRLLIERGLTPQRVSAEVAAMLPTRPNLISERDWRQNRIMATARKATFEKLAACFQILSDTDSRLKGQLPSFDPIETLELMVLEMSGTLAAKPSVRRAP